MRAQYLLRFIRKFSELPVKATPNISVRASADNLASSNFYPKFSVCFYFCIKTEFDLGATSSQKSIACFLET